MPKAGGLRSDDFIKYNGHVCRILIHEPYSPQEGKDMVKLKLHDLDTGRIINETHDADEEFEELELEHKEMEFLNQTEESFTLFEPEDSEYVEIPKYITGESSVFLQENMMISVYYYNGIIASVNLPNIVEMKIDRTDDIEKDKSNYSLSKKAVLSNGHVIDVPAFIKTSDKVLVDLGSGEYIRRK